MICIDCHKNKPTTDFYKGLNRDKISYSYFKRCKECHKERQRYNTKIRLEEEKKSKLSEVSSTRRPPPLGSGYVNTSQDHDTAKVVVPEEPVTTTGHLAIYGNQKIPRVYCRHCLSYALVVENKLQCCGRTYAWDIRGTKRMSSPEFKRRLPGKKEREVILQRQEDRCLYCEQQFGDYVIYHGNLRKLQIHWDHQVPFSYSQDNGGQNFVAACSFCNQWKHDCIFPTLDAARVFLSNKWENERSTKTDVVTGVNRDLKKYDKLIELNKLLTQKVREYEKLIGETK